MIPLEQITSAISVIKTLKDLVTSTGNSVNPQLMTAIDGLSESLTNAREKIIELQDENVALKAKVKELEVKKITQDDIEFRSFAVFKKSNNEGPFCSACWGDKEKLIPLHDKGQYHYFCPVCKGPFCSDRKAYDGLVQRAQGAMINSYKTR